MSVAVIINPISGGASRSSVEQRARIALAAVAAHGDTADVLVSERTGHVRQLTKAAVARGARLVFAWGGDGTINEVASALAFSNVPLGIVPGGSGNGLATELGISHAPEIAIADALVARPRRIDLGELAGRLFVNIAGIGFDAHVAAEFDAAGVVSRGLLGYARITGRALFSYAPLRYQIVCDDREMDVLAVLISIANGTQFGNNARIAPEAVLDDGCLDLVAVEQSSPLRLLRYMPNLFRGTVSLVPGYRTARIREATITCALPMTFHVDGEPVMGGSELHARVHPAALSIAAGGRSARDPSVPV